MGMLDTSPMYLYFFIVPCIILPILDVYGLYFTFYIIFGTNLLTGGLARNAIFFAYFSVSKKRNIKRSPNGMKSPGA